MVELVIKTKGTKASIDDYKFFDNNTVYKSPKPIRWANHKKYNQIETTKQLESIHKDYESTAFLIILNDSIIHEKYFLGYDESSMTNSFSMSKSIISFLLFKSIESKTVESLDEKLVKYYPEFEFKGGKDVTVGDLASMSSGLKWQENYKDLLGITARAYVTKDLKKLMLKSSFIDLPGKKFNYQSGSTQLLAMVIEKANNKKINDLVSDWLWGPIGAEEDALWMIDSKENNEIKAYCCLNSNARDFSKVGRLYKNMGLINGKQVIDSSNVIKSISPRFENNPIYGYGFWLGEYENHKFFSLRGHQGQYVIVFPKIDLILTRLGRSKAKGQSLNGFPKDFEKYISESFKILKTNKLISE
jgi:CubicO group peptidase (beta-lactamase class C family)